MIKLRGKYTDAEIMIDSVDDSLIEQLTAMINHPAFTQPVKIMPDCHAGKGSCIGFTMPVTDKIVPNVVGVDIGCGMLSFNIGDRLAHPLEDIDTRIRGKVPFGFETHEKSIVNFSQDIPWKELNRKLRQFTMAYNLKFSTNHTPPNFDDREFVALCNKIRANIGRIKNSVGTLGGGNHFIEIGEAENGELWITIHTGSRNFGKCVCDYWQSKAVNNVKKEKKHKYNEELEELKTQYGGMELKARIKLLKEKYNLKDAHKKELCYLDGENHFNYMIDMVVAQFYASFNRKMIMQIILKIMNADTEDIIETTHNYIDFNDFIIRKGAVSAHSEERFILPFNMRDGILICNGKGNKRFNCSAPHGAGRVLSRAEAKRKLSLDEFREQMSGIYSSSVCRSTIDEAPNAYKESAIIEKCIEPTADILFRIKPILNMKAK